MGFVLEETVSLFEEGLQLGGVLQEIERPHHLASDDVKSPSRNTRPVTSLRATGAFSSEDLLFQVLFQGGLLATERLGVSRQRQRRQRCKEISGLAELRGDVVKQHRVRARLRHGPAVRTAGPYFGANSRNPELGIRD